MAQSAILAAVLTRWIAIVFAIAALWVVASHLLRRLNWRGSIMSIGEVRGALDWAMKRGINKAMIRIEHVDNQRRFIDVTKRLAYRGGADYSITSTVHRECAAMLATLARDKNMKTDTSERDGMIDVTVHCSQDIEARSKVCAIVFDNEWKLHWSDLVRVRHRGRFIAPLRVAAKPKWIE